MRIINLGNDDRFFPKGKYNVIKESKRNKYGNKKVIVDGITFDSEKEANRYCELKQLERGKVIKDLRWQERFKLIPHQRDENGKLLERAVYYIADFVYTDIKTGQRIVEDTKGFKTDAYIMKRKLMLHVHGIRIREV